jgi:hypothetical protein
MGMDPYSMGMGGGMGGMSMGGPATMGNMGYGGAHGYGMGMGATHY